MKKRLFQVLCLIFLALMLPLSQKISGTQILAADEGAVQIGKENPKYTFNTIDGNSVTTQSEDGRTTVLVFGYTGCVRTKTTLKNIVASPQITAEDTRTIFIECSGAGQEEVINFKEEKCQDTSDKIIYCYVESMDIAMKVQIDYLGRLGGNTESGSYPLIILIDKNNRARQFIQTGSSVTAETLKTEIDKLADPDPGDPSSGPESPIPTIPQPGLGEDPDYTFCSIEGEKIPTTYRETLKKNTVLIFGKTNCGKTKATVQEIAGSAWAGSDNIRVLFAEATGKTQEETAAFAARYGGSSVTFCYDDGETGLDSIYNAMFKYARFDTEIGNSVSFPLIVLIDENSRVRKVVQGCQTAGYIEGELDQIINPSDTTPVPVPTTTPQPNPVQSGFTSISGDTVSVKPSPGKTTTLIFGTIASGQPGNIEGRSMASQDPSDVGLDDTVSNGHTFQTLKNILESDPYKADELHVVFAECGKATQEEIKAYAEQFKDDPNVEFCYAADIEDGAVGNEIQQAMHAYAEIFNLSAESLELPFTVLIDDEDRVQNALEGLLKTEEFSQEVNGNPVPEEIPTPTASPTPSRIPSHVVTSIPTHTPTATDTPVPTDTPEPTDTPVPTETPTPTDTPVPTDTPKPTDTPVSTATPKPVSVPKVSGLKTVSSKRSIKLRWNKIAGADGYIVYQYKNSAWKQIASVKSGKNVYTIQKLKPGNNYRFAIRAYMTQGQEQYFSKSYTSIYAATKPAAVVFKATVKQNKVTLTWKKVKGATGYKIRYRTGKDDPWKTLKYTKGTKFTSKTLESGKAYTFTVKSYKTYKGKTYIGNGKTKKVRIK